MKPTIYFAWFLLCGAITSLSASPPPAIGVAQSARAFTINQASVPGNATILEGTAIRTTTPSDVRLNSGARLTLAASTGATLYRDRAVLESGAATLRSGPAYRIDARFLRIAPAQPDARVDVALEPAGTVRVSARAGNAEVRTAGGLLLARVFPGEALAFDGEPSGTVRRLTGVLRQKGSAFLLEDEATHVTAQLRGANLSRLVGKRATVTGSAESGTPAEGASEIVAVTDADVPGPQAPAGGSGAKAAAVNSGISIKAVGIAAGVVGGGTVGGLAAAGTFSDTVSR